MRDWPPIRPTVHHWDGEWARVDVPTEDGKVCAIEFRQCPIRRTWQLEIADELVRQSPQGIHAALGQALMALGARIDGSKEAT
jgi:hypothetical protein